MKEKKSKVKSVPSNEKKSIIKTVSVKVCASEEKLKLFNIIRDYSEVASEIYDKIMVLSNKNLFDREGNVVISEDDYVKVSRNHKISSDKFKDAGKGFFSDFVESSMSRGFVGFLTQSHTKAQNQNASILRECGFFPFTFSGSVYLPLSNQGGYKYAVIASVHSRVKSWLECSQTTFEEYTKVKSDYEAANAILCKTYPISIIEQFKKWIQECAQYNFRLGKTSCNFFNFFNNVLLQQFKNNTPVYYGSWKSDTGRTIEYSCAKEVVDLLYKKYSVLWNMDNPILSNEDLSNFIEKFNAYNHKKSIASYTKINWLTSPVKLLMGNNYVAIRRQNGLTANPLTKEIVVTMKMPELKNGVDNSKEWLQVKCTFARKGRGKYGYFENLKITPELNSNKKETGCYIFEYDINNKRHRRAIVKEPSFRLVVHNKHMDVNNPKVNDFDIYLVFCMNVEIEPCHLFSSEQSWKIRSEFATSYPELKDFGKHKTIKLTKESVIDKPVRAMGIDLGLRNPFAYSVYEYSPTKSIKEIVSGVYARTTSPELIQYRQLRNACFNFKKLINSTKHYLNGYKDSIDPCWLNFLNEYFLKNIEGYTSYSMDQYSDWLKNHKNVSLLEFKSQKDPWIIKTMTSYLRKMIIRYSNDRRNKSQDFTLHFEWISTLEFFIRAMRSFQMCGFDGKKSKQGQTPYRKLKDRIKNLKLDYMKKMAFQIAEIAKENKVTLVVTEKLENLRGNVYNDRDRNQLYNAWPVGQIKHFIENALANYGILHADADERHTSQIYNKTGEWAYRDEENANILWWVDSSNKLFETHADENAAKNIVQRYLSHHTTQNSISMLQVSEDTYIPVSAFKASDKEELTLDSNTSELNKSKNKCKSPGGKREKGFLSKYFSSSKPVFQLNGGVLTLSQKSFKEFSKLNVSKIKPTRWFFIDNKFNSLIDLDRRKLIEQKIKDKVMVMKK